MIHTEVIYAKEVKVNDYIAIGDTPEGNTNYQHVDRVESLGDDKIAITAGGIVYTGQADYHVVRRTVTA